MKHTLGPWKLVTEGHERYVYSIFGGRELDTAGTRETVLDSGVIWKQEDARLIAAAPDLLEVAKDAEFLTRKVAINWHEARYMVDSLARLANQLREKIAKAEGGE